MNSILLVLGYLHGSMPGSLSQSGNISVDRNSSQISRNRRLIQFSGQEIYDHKYFFSLLQKHTDSFLRDSNIPTLYSNNFSQSFLAKYLPSKMSDVEWEKLLTKFYQTIKTIPIKTSENPTIPNHTDQSQDNTPENMVISFFSSVRHLELLSKNILRDIKMMTCNENLLRELPFYHENERFRSNLYESSDIITPFKGFYWKLRNALESITNENLLVTFDSQCFYNYLAKLVQKVYENPNFVRIEGEDRKYEVFCDLFMQEIKKQLEFTKDEFCLLLELCQKNNLSIRLHFFSPYPTCSFMCSDEPWIDKLAEATGLTEFPPICTTVDFFIEKLIEQQVTFEKVTSANFLKLSSHSESSDRTAALNFKIFPITHTLKVFNEDLRTLLSSLQYMLRPESKEMDILQYGDSEHENIIRKLSEHLYSQQDLQIALRNLETSSSHCLGLSFKKFRLKFKQGEGIIYG